MRFVQTADRLDLLIACGLSVVVLVLLSLWPYPTLHPDFWGAAAMAGGIRPPESPVMGVWTLMARWLCRALGEMGGLAALGVIGRVVGAVFVGVVYLLLRALLSDRVAILPRELAPVSFRLRLLVAVGTFVFACSDPVWRLMQFFSDDMFHVLLAALSICAFILYRRRGNFSWYCLAYVLTGVLAAESPVGVLFAVAFFVANEVMKYRARKASGIVRAYGFENGEMPIGKGGVMGVRIQQPHGAVKVDTEIGDDPAAFFEDEVAEEVDRAATRLENWAFSVFFFTGLIATLFIDGWAFRALDGMSVKSLGAWDYPVVLVASWIGKFRQVITTDDFLAATSFSLVPLIVCYVLMPLATSPKSRLAFPIGWLMLFLGMASWTQLGPFSKLWYWAWDFGRMVTPSGTVQTVLAFFGAGTVTAALQVLCCGCRKRVKGVDTVAVEETRAHAGLRLFGMTVLTALTLLMLFGSATGRQQSLIRRKMALMGDYVKMTADHVRGARWVFTDGSYDDALAMELRAHNQTGTLPVSVMSGHDPYETYLRVRASADAEDTPMLEAGGGEALRFWVNEKPQHLKQSAVQVGYEILKRSRTDHPEPAGMAMRIPANPEEAQAFERANVEAYAFAERALALAGESGGSTGGFDRSVGEKFDFMLWRLARMADQRASARARVDDAQGMVAQRELSQKLDKSNLSVRLLAEKLERLRPAEGVVLTPREGLYVSLRRADFELARRYAYMVLRVDAQDADANFALGMWSLEAREYMRASRHLEAALAKRPKEPAILNNLALAYLKQGDFTRATEHAERAAELYPTSQEVQRNLREIRRAQKEAAEKDEAERKAAAPKPEN